MREDHGFHKADALGDGGGEEVREGGDYVGGEEERAEEGGGEVELCGEEVGNPGKGHEAGGEGVDGEEEAEFPEDVGGGAGDGGIEGSLCFCWGGFDRGLRLGGLLLGVRLGEEAFGFYEVELCCLLTVELCGSGLTGWAEHEGEA